MIEIVEISIQMVPERMWKGTKKTTEETDGYKHTTDLLDEGLFMDGEWL